MNSSKSQKCYFPYFQLTVKFGITYKKTNSIMTSFIKKEEEKDHE